MSTYITNYRNNVSMIQLSINILIEEAESHVVIGFFLWLFFFLFFLFFSCSSTASCWGSTYARTYVGDEILDVAAFKSLGKQSWPVWFYINACCLEDGLDFFSSDGNIIVGQDECGVDTCKFAVCHFNKFEFGMLVPM